MRLICPNCGAQYEVDDGVIPDAGRDVQCSNCGHTWFQQPAHLDAELAEELGAETAVTEELREEPEPEDPPASEPEVPQQTGLDPAIANVLREEAEREAEARRADAEGLEVQTELGIDDAAEITADRSAAARARMARLRGLEETAEDAEIIAAATAESPRSELLPDVEEINSTLRAAEDRGDDAEIATPQPLVEQPRRSGRTLSRLIILAAILAVIVYALAPRIAEYLPGAEPYLAAYVDWTNSVRAQINGLISMAAEKIRGLTG